MNLLMSLFCMPFQSSHASNPITGKSWIPLLAQAFESKKKTKTKSKNQASSSKGVKKTKSKASFRRSEKRAGLKAKGVPKDPVMYGSYDLTDLPEEAHPDDSRRNAGNHSYTLGFNGAVLEVLLQKQAFFVKKVGPTGSGPLGQVSWAKHDGPHNAFLVAKERAGFDRYGRRA